MTPALFSVSYAGYWGQAALDLPSFIRKAGKLGYPSVMLAGKRPHLSVLDTSSERIEEIRSVLDDSGVRCDVIAAYTNLVQPTGVGGEVPHLELQIAYVETLCRIAAVLGAGVVRLFTAYEATGQDLSQQWNRCVSTIREMADRALPHGVSLAIQNHHDIGLETGALLDLLEEIDRTNCGLGFDAWSPALRGESLHEAALLAASRTLITTNADYIRVPRHRYRPEFVNYERVEPDWVRAVPFGEGFIDYPAFFAGLREGGFRGVATYEMCSPVRGGGGIKNLDRLAGNYLAWMRNSGGCPAHE
ncbi:MAG: TIM barrel protein [Verrucomicrobiae bacterium]|nr:TIM barrel protein [Verrucomicrobiae bacterium]